MAMIGPTEADLGRRVVYRTRWNTEEGVVTSFNEKYVFVRYGDDHHSKATYPQHLFWTNETQNEQMCPTETASPKSGTRKPL